VSRRGRRLANAVTNITSIGVLALVLANQAALPGSTPGGPPPGEFELKGVFVLNFIRLVNWTNVPGEGTRPDLPVCALANSDFANAVRQAVAGKTIGNRPVSFKFTSAPDPLQCRVLIVDAAQYPVARQALNSIRDAPVLTAGNGPGFLSMGGMFELTVQDRQVQFDANLEAIRRAKLDVSARLLQLSRNLRKGGSGGL
jgi:hypothetical protein